MVESTVVEDILMGDEILDSSKSWLNCHHDSEQVFALFSIRWSMEVLLRQLISPLSFTRSLITPFDAFYSPPPSVLDPLHLA